MCLPTLVWGILLILLPATSAAEIRAAVENGFETSAPLEVGFVRVRLENTGKVAERVTVSLPAELVEQDVELPPTSRKELPIIATEAGPVVVQSGRGEIIRHEVQAPYLDATVLVISNRETGLRALTRDPQFPQPVTGGLSYAASSGQPPPSSSGISGAVRVLTVPPAKLPPSAWGYRSLGDKLLIVVHPGGFDALSRAQREALRVTATNFADLVLVSEGKQGAFRGTPFEDLVPGTERTVTSYDQWPLDFSGASPEASALTVIVPAADAITSQTTPDGFPLLLQTERSSRSITYIPFDYTAPPLRSWNAKPFWESLMTRRSTRGEPAIQVFTASFLDWERKHRLQLPPSLLQVSLAVAVLALGYAAAVMGLRRGREEPSSYRYWVTAPVFLVGAFALATAAGTVSRRHGLRLWETTILLPAGETVGLRSGIVGISGPGGVRNLSARSPETLLKPSGIENRIFGRVRLASQAPAVLQEAELERAGQMIFSTRDITPMKGPVSLAASPNVAATGDFRIQLFNYSGLQIQKAWMFIGGQYAELELTSEDIPPQEVNLQKSPAIQQRSGGISLPPADITPEEALIRLAAWSSTRPFSQGRLGFAVARVKPEPVLPGTSDAVQYLVFPVTSR